MNSDNLEELQEFNNRNYKPIPGRLFLGYNKDRDFYCLCKMDDKGNVFNDEHRNLRVLITHWAYLPKLR